jgi:hypothetical protein
MWACSHRSQAGVAAAVDGESFPTHGGRWLAGSVRASRHVQCDCRARRDARSSAKTLAATL